MFMWCFNIWYKLVIDSLCKYMFFHFFIYRYVTIEPDARKLLNATNVLGLMVDTILREGFRLISTRTVSPEEKIECYTFERRGTLNILINDPYKADVSPVPKQTEKSTKKGKSHKWLNQYLPCMCKNPQQIKKQKQKNKPSAEVRTWGDLRFPRRWRCCVI